MLQLFPINLSGISKPLKPSGSNEGLSPLHFCPLSEAHTGSFWIKTLNFKVDL
jgi:hypothetical protein